MIYCLRFLLPAFLFLTMGTVHAQVYRIAGTVTDAATGEALAFVNIVANNGSTGTSSDIDGRFSLQTPEPIQQVRFSYVGYEPRTITADSLSLTLKVRLKSTVASLSEIVITPGVNPAHRIVHLATSHRDKNNPEKIPSFRYTSYNKLVLTAVPLQANMADTMSLKTASDSSVLEMRKLMEKHHLFVMETITERHFMAPSNSKEVVLASRTSGFKKANIAFLSTNLQPFSLYTDFIPLSGRSYINPLSKGSTRKYDFMLEDTTFSGVDTVFVISFSPSRDKNFESLKGLLYINSDGWALQNIIAEPAHGDLNGLRIQQQYQKIDGRWFPVQLNTDFVLPNVIMGGHQPTAISRSYITNISFNPGLSKKDFDAVAVDIKPDANNKTGQFWQEHRTDSLSVREINTYTVLDSIGEKENLDAKLQIFESLISGRYPLGYADLDITRLLQVNRYEGIRLGAGLYTSERVSKFFTVGGYAGYGFRDKAFKYGSDATFFLYRPASLNLTVAYAHDIAEAGATFLPFRNRSFLDSKLRYLVVNNMDKVEHKSAFISFRTLKYLSVRTGLRQENKQSTNGYVYEVSADNWSNKFRFTEGVIGLRYAFREQLTRAGKQLISMGTAFPVLWLQYTRGLQGPELGQFGYNKYDVRLESGFRTKTLGFTKIDVSAGLAQGDIPFSNLYNGHGSYSPKVAIYAAEGFETMEPAEFAADKYAAIYLKHSFGKMLYRSAKFSPEIVLATNIGFGTLSQPNRHRIITEHGPVALKTMQDGYYESGIIVNEILKSSFTSMGIAVFGRYGAYSKPKPIDNLVAKLSVSYTL